MIDLTQTKTDCKNDYIMIDLTQTKTDCKNDNIMIDLTQTKTDCKNTYQFKHHIATVHYIK